MATTSGDLLSRGLVLTLAASCGITVANLYFNQPLLTLIATELHVSMSAVARVSMATQLGYASGLLLLGPLGDRLPRKQLILSLAAALVATLIAAAAARTLTQLVFASLGVGIAATLAQQLVPLAAQLAPEQRRGRVVGSVMSGLLFGLLGGRVIAGFVGQALGFRAVFMLGAGSVALMGFVLARVLPSLPAQSRTPYLALLRSTLALVRAHATLRAAALHGALLFGSFSVFWVALTPLLTAPPFALDGRAAGLFGVIGMAGALVAPLAGRLTDEQGPTRVLTIAGSVVVASWCLFALSSRSLFGLAVGTLLLDVGIQAAQIANQARIYALQADARSRLNAVYMTSYFVGGAAGSLTAGLVWSAYGWSGAVAAGLALAGAAVASHFAYVRTSRPGASARAA